MYFGGIFLSIHTHTLACPGAFVVVVVVCHPIGNLHTGASETVHRVCQASQREACRGVRVCEKNSNKEKYVSECGSVGECGVEGWWGIGNRCDKGIEFDDSVGEGPRPRRSTKRRRVA